MLIHMLIIYVYMIGGFKINLKFVSILKINATLIYLNKLLHEMS